VASLSQGRTAAAQCGLFTHKSVPVIFEPPCINKYITSWLLANYYSCSCVGEDMHTYSIIRGMSIRDLRRNADFN